jgi:putative effector of murein hydrolase LrgA (UPF0299 family)
MKNFMYGAIASFAFTSIAHIVAVDFGMRLPPPMTGLIVLLSAVLSGIVSLIQED